VRLTVATRGAAVADQHIKRQQGPSPLRGKAGQCLRGAPLEGREAISHGLQRRESFPWTTLGNARR
jgi:hypothetical protein